MPPAPSGQGREEKATRATWRTFKRFSAWLNSFCNYPLCPPGGASEGLLWETCGFPPRGPSLQPPPESPFPFRVERLPVRPASSCSNKSFAFGTLELVGTGSHGGATKLNASFSPFPPSARPGGTIFLRSCPHPWQFRRRRAGVRTKGDTLVLTSCRPAYGDSPPGGHEGRVVEGRG